jgi:hypothetical protein
MLTMRHWGRVYTLHIMAYVSSPLLAQKASMARPPRLDLPGAWYHVLNRGIEKRLIFRSRHCYGRFLELRNTLPGFARTVRGKASRLRASAEPLPSSFAVSASGCKRIVPSSASSPWLKKRSLEFSPQCKSWFLRKPDAIGAIHRGHGQISNKLANRYS